MNHGKTKAREPKLKAPKDARTQTAPELADLTTQYPEHTTLLYRGFETSTTHNSKRVQTVGPKPEI